MLNCLYAFLTAAAVVIVLAPVVIAMLKRMGIGQTERDDGPKTHLIKEGTPTMGGIVIVLGIVAASLIFSGGELTYILPCLLITVGYSLVGMADDILKIRYKKQLAMGKQNLDKHKNGLRAYQKIIAQFGIALVVAIYFNKSIGTEIYLPYMGVALDLGWLYIPMAMFVNVATVNSVNLLDGLDGLASGVTSIYSASMCLILLVLGAGYADSGLVLYEAAATGSSVFAAGVAGGCMGFLLYNSYPAKVFMGDTGSMALGGAVVSMVLFSRSVLLLPIMGICYLASSVSVILQVGSYKLRNKKRVFLMAPLHHHFEKKGIPEKRVTLGYYVVTILVCVACIAGFMLR